VEQATVAVGLAAFGNDETVFLIATDTAVVDIDPVSQELLLRVSMALEGEETSINRFGYQVVAIVTTQTTGISGTIRWDRHLFDASQTPASQIAQMFQITANHVDHVVPSGGFAFDKYTPRAYGVTTQFASDQSDFLVSYEIPGAPYNDPLVVRVEVGTLFPANHSSPASQIAGPVHVILTINGPGVTGVDFRVLAPPSIR
jgi:hypothetical protein